MIEVCTLCVPYRSSSEERLTECAYYYHHVGQVFFCFFFGLSLSLIGVGSGSGAAVLKHPARYIQPSPASSHSPVPIASQIRNRIRSACVIIFLGFGGAAADSACAAAKSVFTPQSADDSICSITS